MVSKATRITGNKKMIISADGVNRAQELKSFTIENDDANGDPTFWEAAGGQGRDYTANGTYKQDTAADSFTRWCWANEGLTVQCRYAPHGNDVATADQPHWVYTAQVGAPGTVGGDASYDGDEMDADFTWKITSGKPVLDDGSSTKPLVGAVAPGGASVGQTVAISGSKFSAATAVKFGSATASFVVLNDGTIAATLPTGTTGTKQVTVTGPGGTSDNFAYTAAS